MRDCASAADRLCDPDHEVSAHWLIDRDGTLLRLVPEDRRAWHAGAGSWGGQGDVNSRSIGIELDNDGRTPFDEPLMVALEGLLARILTRHEIPPHHVIGHSDMAPGRKGDPGPHFDWCRLARAGLSVWPDGESAEVDAARFAADAARFGYPDVAPDLLLVAIRLRFRPGASGPLDARDMGIAADLARRFPVDRQDGGA